VLPFNLMGMNATLMIKYIQFCADCLLHELKQPNIYNVTNPFPWMDIISLWGKTKFDEQFLWK
jgi:ribonucleotide reductase beta subunit family protein with ferritin-like domain